MIGGEESIRRAGGRFHRVAGLVDYELGIGVALADAPDIPDVMAQQGNCEIQPVGRRDTAFLVMLAFQDVLADDRYQNGVLDIMIQGIGVGDALKRHSGAPRDNARIARFQIAEVLQIIRFEPLDKCPDNYFSNTKHITSRDRSYLPARRY